MKKLKEILDHEEIVKTLVSAIKSHKLKHGYLFVGEKGVGKKTLAQSFIQGIICTDFREDACGVCRNCQSFQRGNYDEIYSIFDDGSSVKINELREIKDKINYVLENDCFRIIFIENIDRLTLEASNSILKILEEPSNNTIFIFTAIRESAILDTIKSRMEIYRLKNLSHTTLDIILEEMGYEQRKFLEVGSIDKAVILLESKEEKLYSLEEFLELVKNKKFIGLMTYSDEVHKKEYFQSLLTYYIKDIYLLYKQLIEENKKEINGYTKDFLGKVLKALWEVEKRISLKVASNNAFEYGIIQMLRKEE